MNPKSFRHPLAFFIAMGILLLAASGVYSALAAPDDFVTVITVNTGQDFNTSMSESCATYPDDCSLRRAIVQARALAPAARPALIQFSIPEDPAEGWDATLDLWHLTILAPSDQYVFRDLTGGLITIDGTTQPNGRTTGPTILLVGPSTLKRGINISSGEGYEIRGLGFQNFTVMLTLSSLNSLVENNWFGLNDEGTAPAWRDEDDHSQGSGTGGLDMTSVAEGNTIRTNVFLGLIGNAATIRGDGNLFDTNYVGTNFEGEVTGKLTDPSLSCTEVDWYGGSGILVDGPDHAVVNNVIAGIRLDIFISSSQPDAIWAESTCDRCYFENNQIGVDADGTDVGVCGQGIDITDGEQMDVINNVFAETYHSAIFLNGALYKDNTIHGNIIRRSTPWLQPEGQPKADDAILRFTGLPDPFELFNPAQVTEIDGVNISGTAGVGNPCPNCFIEIFLDDDDGINEALELLTTAIADASGNWTATLPYELPDGFGLRTSSTSAQFNTIPNMNAGTTAGLSVLYVPYTGTYVYLPLIKR